LIAILAVPAMLLCAPASGVPLDARQVGEFIDFMVKEHEFDAAELTKLFAQASAQERVLDTISRPAEKKPWFEYRPIFITPARIEGGVTFWNEHAEALRRAYEHYGVPPQVIVAILGVETFYGRQPGSYRVLEAVATLAFHYPKRAAFFRKELEQFLLMAREERLDAWTVTGSYAGAMGTPQFVASSFRRYAVDFDADGRKDIWSSVDDAIGSVAHYLGEHGWRRDEPIAMPARAPDPARAAQLAAYGLQPQLSAEQLAESGLLSAGELGAGTRATVIELEQNVGKEYWVGFQNFYVITRYNNSASYAMAVHQLADEIRVRHES
jgi:membrane-bound lytic murein transglycosylase B